MTVIQFISIAPKGAAVSGAIFFLVSLFVGRSPLILGFGYGGDLSFSQEPRHKNDTRNAPGKVAVAEFLITLLL